MIRHIRCSASRSSSREWSPRPINNISSLSTGSNFVASTLKNNDVSTLSSHLHERGYVPTARLLTPDACQKVRGRMPRLFRGEFETGIYPDEWHWREGISRDDAAREMCNSWKSDRSIASIVLYEDLGRLVAQVMGWDSVRIAQDDLLWKPPAASFAADSSIADAKRIDTVGFHQDSAYISSQFCPYENNSVTLWMALDDADEENGCIEYAVGSHNWTQILHLNPEEGEGASDSTSDNEMSSFHSSDEFSYRDGISMAAALAGVGDPLKVIEPAPVKEGYAIFHHQGVWHGSGPNRSSTRHRRALVAHYIRGDVTFMQDENSEQSPFGRASYIYGRYKKYKSVELDESFFPIIYGSGGGLARTAWVDNYLA